MIERSQFKLPTRDFYYGQYSNYYNKTLGPIDKEEALQNCATWISEHINTYKNKTVEVISGKTAIGIISNVIPFDRGYSYCLKAEVKIFEEDKKPYIRRYQPDSLCDLKAYTTRLEQEINKVKEDVDVIENYYGRV